MKFKLLFIAIASFMFLKNEAQECRPMKCVITSMRPAVRDSFMHFWLYDNQGRLICDSTFPAQRNGPFLSEYYRYFNDSMEGSNRDGSKVLVKLNPNGFPLQTIITNSTSCSLFNAFYKKNGMLTKILFHHEPLVPLPAKIPTLDTINETIDKIIYKKGNIVSYRVSIRSVANKNSAGVVKNSVRQTMCEYYDKPYSQIFDPTIKMFGLSTYSYGVIGFFNTQSFSKMLLKSVRGNTLANQIDYAYKFDPSGKVTEIDFAYPNECLPGYTRIQKYEYECK